MPDAKDAMNDIRCDHAVLANAMPLSRYSRKASLTHNARRRLKRRLDFMIISEPIEDNKVLIGNKLNNVLEIKHRKIACFAEHGLENCA